MATKLTKAEKSKWIELVSILSNALYSRNLCTHIDILSFCAFFETSEEFEKHCRFYMKNLRQDATSHAVDLTPCN